MTGGQIAKRALAEIGTEFRIYGRTSGVALDCAGLVAMAIGAPDVRTDYSLKGNYQAEIESYFSNHGFWPVNDELQTGDIALTQCSPSQCHLMICAANGWVHAHAGLGRVVHTPGPSPWPIMAVWRAIGG
jgi:murein DD-endopeptidase / murein LD-carboxypeptidase